MKSSLISKKDKMKYKKPKLFVPTQKELEIVGKEIAKNLTSNSVVVAGDKKIRGTKIK